MDCLYSLMRTKCWGHWQVGRAGHRELSQDHEIGLITKGWEAGKLHGGKWGELQVEGIPQQRRRRGRNQEAGGPQSGRVRESVT